jgi:hypothetical protein
MTEQKFKSEMRRAEAMRRSAEPERAEYWAGYIRGLRRSYHGEKFGTSEEHTLWLSLTDRQDEACRQRGYGYRDGLAYSEVQGKTGRPSIGKICLDKITVSEEIKTGLEKRAEYEGISVPEARRQAYKQYLDVK